MKILIVEDDPDSRLMMQNILQSRRHCVLTAANGVQALASAHKERPDLIISDIMMPQMDGFELCYALKHDSTLQHIPLIFCTATYVDSADERLALQLGAERFMLKPIEPEQLLDTVAEFESGTLPSHSDSAELKLTHLPHDEFMQKHQPRITRKLDQKIRELELYKNIYQNSSDLFCILSPAGSILQANAAFRRFFSCSEEDLQHLDLGAYLLDHSKNDLLNRVGNNEVFESEVRVQIKEEPNAHLEISALPFLDENAQLSAIIVQARDITERCRHAEELEMLRRLVDISNDAFFVIREDDGGFEFVNERACERLGYAYAELMNLSVIDIVTDFPDIEEWHKHVAAMQKNPAAVFESVHIRKDGSRFPVEVSVMHDQSLNGPPLISAVARDITERLQAVEEQKELEAKLNQAQIMEALGTMAGGIAHDFNNIIGAIHGYTEMAQRNVEAPEKVKTCLAQVEKASQRARELVAQIQDFSRRGQHALKSVQLDDIVTEVVELLRPNIAENVEIKHITEKPCPKVLADPGQMHQVIMNLCTNALHAIENQDRGSISIRIKTTTLDKDDVREEIGLEPGTYVELQVHDNGVGIDAESIKRIFEPYFSTRKKHGGTGLGLAVVHGIIKDFSGSISVDSTPGNGTVFRVLLPAVETRTDIKDKINAAQEKTAPTGQALPTQKHCTPEPGSGPKRVLVVDDEAALLDLTKRILQQHGYEVTSTTSSRHALEMVRQHRDRFDLLITDYAMPDMDGIELATEVRSIRSDIPVLLCSSYYAGKEQRRSGETGIEMVLNKPIQDYQLTLAVDSILNT